MSIRRVNAAKPVDQTDDAEAHEEVPSNPPVRQRRRPPPSQPDQAQPPASRTSDGGYEVGYGKPPRHSQFKPGRSGNPKGRPKGAKGLNTHVRNIMTEKVKVRTPAGYRMISRIEAVLHKTNERAMKGSESASTNLLRLYAGAVPDADSTAEMLQPGMQELTAADRKILELFEAQLRGDAEEDQ